MYAILAEDKSDVETLKVLIRRVAENQNISVKGVGYSGCSQMLNKGARQLQAFYESGACKRFVVCYDSDKESPVARRQEIIRRVVSPSRVTAPICVLIPVQEIETWILADINAVSKVISGWRPDVVVSNPEGVNDPKEYLEKISRQNQRPRYTHAVHNQKIAQYLNIDEIYKKCPSFRPLYEIVKNGNGNV